MTLEDKRYSGRVVLAIRAWSSASRMKAFTSAGVRTPSSAGPTATAGRCHSV